MNIIETQIIDFGCVKNTDDYKVLLMNELIENVAPLLHEELRKKKEQILVNKSKSEDLKKDIEQLKSKLSQTKINFEIEIEKKKVYESIQNLISKNILDDSIKKLTLNIIESLDKKTLEELKQQRLLLQEIVNKPITKKGKK